MRLSCSVVRVHGVFRPFQAVFDAETRVTNALGAVDGLAKFIGRGSGSNVAADVLEIVINEGWFQR